jgi:hypothetical protein
MGSPQNKSRMAPAKKFRGSLGVWRIVIQQKARHETRMAPTTWMTEIGRGVRKQLFVITIVQAISENKYT